MLTEPRHTLSINSCTISQYAALAALTGPQACVDTMRDQYRVRRDVMLAWLDADARFRVGGSALGPGWSGKEVNVGLGQDWKQWHFDYAYTYPLRVSALGGMHRFSLKHNWR